MYRLKRQMVKCGTFKITSKEGHRKTPAIEVLTDGINH